MVKFLSRAGHDAGKEQRCEAGGLASEPLPPMYPLPFCALSLFVRRSGPWRVEAFQLVRSS